MVKSTVVRGEVSVRIRSKAAVHPAKRQLGHCARAG
jgi:hypothetical protein